MAKRILVAGSSNIDFLLTTPYIPAPGETMISSGKYAFTPGGKGANAAIATKEMGAEVVFCSRVGDDAYGDRLVALFNERGIVLCGAYVTERLMPGVCYVDHGSRLDPIIPGWLDRGGAINTITPTASTSQNATGMAVSGFLTQVEKVSETEWESWKRDYPEAFARPLDEGCGVCLDGWLIQD